MPGSERRTQACRDLDRVRVSKDTSCEPQAHTTSPSSFRTCKCRVTTRNRSDGRCCGDRRGCRDDLPRSSREEVRVNATTDYDDKMRIHAATVAYRQGRLSRRDLLKYLGAAGVAL